MERRQSNLNQARGILAQAQKDLEAATSAQAQVKQHVEEARGRVNAVLGSGIQLNGLKEAQGMLALLTDNAGKALPQLQATHAKVRQASGS